jgi:hypothetical protein
VLVPLVVAVLGLLIVQYLVLIKQIELLMLKHAGVVTQISRFLTRSASICAMPSLLLITTKPLNTPHICSFSLGLSRCVQCLSALACLTELNNSEFN